MRPRIHTSWGVALVAACALTLGGCSLDLLAPSAAQQGSPPANPAATPDADSLTAQTQQQAQRLNEALAKPGHNPAPADPNDVVWIDTGKSARPASATPRAQKPQANPPAVVVANAPTTQPADGPAADRQALVSRLLQDIRNGPDTAITKSVGAVAVSLLDPSRPLDPADLAALQPGQRDQVLRYQQVVALIARQFIAGNTVTADDIVEQLSQALREQPLRMRSVQLCKKVSGYGVYEPFDGANFLAGREQPMIVYTELDHFRSAKDAMGQYQVKLTQEIVLYNDADGLAVWRQPTAEIIDQSRNRRRDFFVVQLIRLPARLTVGKYRLKVRLNDLNGGSIDESAVPLQIVADQAMVAK